MACPTLAAACVEGQLKPCELPRACLFGLAAAPLAYQHLFWFAPRREHCDCYLPGEPEQHVLPSDGLRLRIGASVCVRRVELDRSQPRLWLGPANNNHSARAEARARTNVGQSVGPQPTRRSTLAAARKASVALPRGLRLESGMQSLVPPTATPNPSVNRTPHGRPGLGLISFWPNPGLPRVAGYLER